MGPAPQVHRRDADKQLKPLRDCFASSKSHSTPMPALFHRRHRLDGPDRPRVWRAAAWLGLWLGAAGVAAAADTVQLPVHPAVPAITKIPLPARPVNQAAGEGASGKPALSPRGEQLREAIEKANEAAPPASTATPRRAGASAAEPVTATPQFTFRVAPEKKAGSAKRPPAEMPADEAGPAPRQAAAANPATPPISPAGEVHRQYLRARAAALGPFADTPQAAAAVGIRPPPRSPAKAAVTVTANANATASAATKAAAVAAPPWSYQGAGGPLSWGQLKPEFATCASGQRQSPIAIDDSTALVGPAEPLSIDYKPAGGSVLHTGRLLQVEVLGDNSLTVRGTRYRLERVEFHHPAEERINGKGFAMSVHLLHRSADGQLANVAVLLEPGAASALVDQVVTYLPLDVKDRVGLPPAGLDVNTLLPQDRRYYQFFGSLTTPPCTEDVLWIIFKEPMPVSAAQLKLFGQLFPNNTRPLQPVNGRVVRAAQ